MAANAHFPHLVTPNFKRRAARSESDRVARVSYMAAFIVLQVRRKNGCLDRDLIEHGFSRDEIDQLGEDAREIAAAQLAAICGIKGAPVPAAPGTGGSAA